MKLCRRGTLRMVGRQAGRPVEFHRFCGSWFIRRDGVTIRQNIKTVLQAQTALRGEDR